MFGIISKYKNLYVTDHINYIKEKELTVVRSSSNLLIGEDRAITPYVTDFITESTVLLGENTQKLSYYVNILGFPKKGLPTSELERQEKVVKKVKDLHLRRI